MAARRALFKQADVTRAMRAVAAGGGTVAKVDILPDGRISIVTGAAAPTSEPADPFEKWKAQRDARAS